MATVSAPPATNTIVSTSSLVAILLIAPFNVMTAERGTCIFNIRREIIITDSLPGKLSLSDGYMIVWIVTYTLVNDVPMFFKMGYPMYTSKGAARLRQSKECIIYRGKLGGHGG